MTRPALPAGWQRLHVRVTWVDLARSVLSLLPAALSVWVLGIDPGSGGTWPLFGIAAAGLIGGAADALRWTFTRYRITPTHVELRTGVFRRVHRSIRRDRIRSVDTAARLRHRLAGLRVVKIGAGQQAASGESALALDAVSRADARALRRLLLPPAPAVPAPREAPESALREAPAPDTPRRATPAPSEAPDPRETHEAPLAQSGSHAPSGSPAPLAAFDSPAPLAVFARFEPRWVVYNMFNFWAYVLAAGVAWGGYWLLSGFGVDVSGAVAGLLDREGAGRAQAVAAAFAAVSAVGVLALAVSYFTEYWNFELARVPGRDGTLLRTRRGLFTTREVNRDENRIRGAQISEPGLWIRLGIADARVITTGLSMWAPSQPADILPRGPVAAARRVTGRVLGGAQNPLEAALAPHPRAALRRRLVWATAVPAVLALVLAWLSLAGAVPAATLWAAAALWPCALGAAAVAYRALGHAIAGPYLVTRSGLVTRSTTALRRSAVSTIVIRESLLQRRLGLRTVSAMTAAGEGGYDTPDIGRDESLAFAVEAAPGLLGPFVTAGGEGDSGCGRGDSNPHGVATNRT